MLLGAFLLLEQRQRIPMLDLTLFRSATYTGANLAMLLVTLAMFGIFFYNSLFIQNVLHYSAIRTGLAFLPLNLTIGLFSLGITARVMARVGAKRAFIPGLVLVGAALLLFSRMPVHGSYVADVMPGMLVFGLGAGLSFAPGVALAMAEAGPTDSGVASGLANVTLQLGAALGLAVLASFSTLRTSHLLAAGASLPAALTGGYHVAFLIGAGCLAAGTVLASALLRPGTPRASSTEKPRTVEMADV